MVRVALSLLLVILAVPAALACSCMPWPPPLEALDEATAVFTGRILRADPTDVPRGYCYTIEVHASWKGVATEEILVTTDDVAMCGLMMQVGKTYLVYSYGELEALSTNNCSRSRETRLAGDDLAELGDPIMVAAAGRTFTSLKSRYE